MQSDQPLYDRPVDGQISDEWPQLGLASQVVRLELGSAEIQDRRGVAGVTNQPPQLQAGLARKRTLEHDQVGFIHVEGCAQLS